MRGLECLDRFSVKILRFLSKEPMKSFYQRETARAAGVSVGKTNQVLKALEQEEIVLKERKGRINLYRYNLHDPVARHLKILFTLVELSELVRRLRQVSEEIVLFGSCAEGIDTAESDIDLFILTNDKDELRRTVALARRTLDRRLSPVVLNPVEFSELRDRDRPLYEQISRGIELWRKE